MNFCEFEACLIYIETSRIRTTYRDPASKKPKTQTNREKKNLILLLLFLSVCFFYFQRSEVVQNNKYI